MSPLWWAIVFGGSLIVAAAVISVACLHRFALDNARDTRARLGEWIDCPPYAGPIRNYSRESGTS